MASRAFKFGELFRLLWREVVGGVIAIGLATLFGIIYTSVVPMILAAGIALLAIFIFVLWLLAGRAHKVLVYVSAGSTCRDPMAKAITEQLLAGRKLKHPVDVYAVGLVPDGKAASHGARQAIQDSYGVDLLKDHIPTAFTLELIEKADLILVMDKELFDATKNTLPRNKTYILKQFFELDGDIEDPFRLNYGEHDAQTLARYKACADELKQILSTHMDQLLKALAAI